MLRKLGGFVPVALLLAGMVLPIACGTSTSSPDPVDTDGDGLSDRDELLIYGTSPLMADTDGDGWSDYAEVIDFGFDPVHAPLRFNPRIADLPQLEIVMTSPPLLTIQTTDATGETFTVSTTRTDQNMLSVTSSVSETNSESESISTSTTVTETVEVTETVTIPGDASADEEEEEREEEKDHDDDHRDGGAADSGAKKDGGVARPPRTVSVLTGDTVSSTFNPTTTVTASFDFTESQTEAYTQALALTQEYMQSHVVTRISGVLLVTASVQNHGDVGFRVTNLLFTATMVNGPSMYTPIGNMSVQAPYSNFQPFSLAPGEATAPMNFVAPDLTLQAVEAMFANVQSITVQLGLFEVVDATERAYGFTIGNVYTKTAAIVIEYGGRLPDQYLQVSTKADPSRTSVTVRKAFEDIMRIPYEVNPYTGLLSIRNIGTTGQDAGHWVVVHEHPNAAGVIITTYYDPTVQPFDFGDIELYAGDVLRVVYVDP